MGFSIQGTGSLALNVNTTPIQISTGEQTLVCVRDNVKQLLPTLELRFLDGNNSFTKVKPADGSTIQIKLGDGNVSSKDLNFVCFGTPHKAPSSNGYLYNLSGLSDKGTIVRECPSTSIEGSSIEVYKQAAAKFNLNFTTNMTTTNDAMVWRPGRQTWGTFLKYVSAHGYARDGGFMSSAIDSEGNLFLMDVPYIFAQKNIDAVIYSGNPSFGESINTNKKIPCIQYKHINRAGFHNNMDAFGSRTSQHDPLNPDSQNSKYSNVTAQTSGNFLDINKTIYKQINKNAKLTVSPINSGNGHDNYIKARHQNVRVMSTYSNNLYVMLAYQSGLSLFDKVYFKAGDSTHYDETTVGFYIVTGKVRIIKGGRYFEKLELTNSGPAQGTDLL